MGHRRAGAWVVAVALVASACTSAGPPDDPTVRASAAGSSAAGRSAETATPDVDVGSGAALPADFSDVTLPAGICRADAPEVTLDDGRGDNVSAQAAVEHDGDPGFEVSVQQPSRGVRADLDGDGTEDAALALMCEGFAGGNGYFPHVVVVSTDADGLVLLADLEPDTHGTGVGGVGVALHDGRLRSVDDVYLDEDPRCCPSGRGFTEWSWDGAGFVQLDAGLAASSDR